MRPSLNRNRLHVNKEIKRSGWLDPRSPFCHTSMMNPREKRKKSIQKQGQPMGSSTDKASRFKPANIPISLDHCSYRRRLGLHLFLLDQ